MDRDYETKHTYMASLIVPVALLSGGVWIYNNLKSHERSSASVDDGMICVHSVDDNVTSSQCRSGQNETYKVRQLPDRYQAVNLLKSIHRNLQMLNQDALQILTRIQQAHTRQEVLTLCTQYEIIPQTQNLQSFPMKSFIRDLKSMTARFSSLQIQESIPTTKSEVGVTSYTDGKEVMSLCLRDPKTQTLHDLNTLMYTAVHELAHLGSTIGHTPDFKLFFQFLRRRAITLRLYRDIDFTQDPKSFCGTTIANNVAIW